MSSEEQKIKDFFGKKPGYIRTGAKKIAKMTGVSDIRLINKIRKELEGERSLVEKKEISVTPELIKAVLEVINGTSVIPENTNNTISKLSKYEPVNKKKFTTPGIHLLMGCNHVPFHDVTLHQGIRNLITDLGDKMVGFHLLGDFCDINALSSHDKGKFTVVPGMTLKDEYIDCDRELQLFEDVLPKSVVDKSFLYGNHEDRVFRYNSDMQNAKSPAILPHDYLSLNTRGYSVHTNWKEDYITIGEKLDLFHGIYFNVHNAKKHLDTFDESCAYVHTHRSQMYREGNKAAYNIGACADFKSAAFGYASRAMKSNWANGFALVQIDENGEFFFTQIDVKDSNFFYNGKKY